MPVLSLLSPRVWIELLVAAIIAAACWYAYNWVYDRGAESVQVKWDAETFEETKQSAKIAAEALATTKSLQEGANHEQKAKNAQIASLNSKLDTAIAGLSNRPSRTDPSDVPKSPGTCPICTGAGLSREDAEFLTREATRAKALDINLASCEADYARVATALN